MWILLLALTARSGPAYVVGGQPSLPGAWPQTAALDYNGFIACSGVLIDPEWVLTAGHCSPTVDFVHLDTTEIASPGESHAVDAFVVHPDAFSTFDVALAHLAEPATVEPLPLALDCVASDWIRVGQPLVIAGFGATDTSGQVDAERLNEAEIAIVDPVCADEYAGCNLGAMPAGELIAGGGGVDSCIGDSGAPVYLFAADRAWVAGVTSRAAIPAQTPCGDGGIYVRADAVAEWIETTAGIVLARPDCAGLNRPPSIEVAPMALQMNQVARQVPAIDDPNLDQALAVSIATPPDHGWAAFANGELVYAPDANFLGSDRFLVEVTDDGEPAESAEAWVEVEVHNTTAPKGCNHVPGSASWLGLGLLLGLRRR